MGRPIIYFFSFQLIASGCRADTPCPTPYPPNSLIRTVALRHKGLQPNGKSPDTNYWNNYRIPSY